MYRTTLYYVLIYVLPVLILVVLTSFLIRALHQSRRMRNNMLKLTGASTLYSFAFFKGMGWYLWGLKSEIYLFLSSSAKVIETCNLFKMFDYRSREEAVIISRDRNHTSTCGSGLGLLPVSAMEPHPPHSGVHHQQPELLWNYLLLLRGLGIYLSCH